MGGITFQPHLAEMVMDGRKTVTRRLCSDNPRSPWWRERCGLEVGRDYAVQPGRGRPAVGRAFVVSVDRQRLGVLHTDEAGREGFGSSRAFVTAWEQINGTYDPDVDVWRVELRALRSGDQGEYPPKAAPQ